MLPCLEDEQEGCRCRQEVNFVWGCQLESRRCLVGLAREEEKQEEMEDKGGREVLVCSHRHLVELAREEEKQEGMEDGGGREVPGCFRRQIEFHQAGECQGEDRYLAY